MTGNGEAGRGKDSGEKLSPQSSDLSPAETARRRFEGKRVTVVGVAREGLSLVRFLAGVGARVTANDRAAALPESATGTLAALGVETVLGGHPEELLLGSDVVFVSPGVPQGVEAIRKARQAGVPISSETQLFFELCPGKILGITGSSGKTTTTALVGEMLRRAGMPVHVGGNIGTPLIENVDAIGPYHWAVLEMSSFQLETLPYSPNVAAILNITPNHLDRHAGMEAYTAAKQNIVQHQREGDRAVLNADDPVGSSIQTFSPPTWFSISRRVDGAYLHEGKVVVGTAASAEVACDVAEIRLRGRHNLANVVAAAAIASCAGVPVPVMGETIRSFTGVPHRLEIVADLGGVIYCNDSIATAPERAMASLRSFDQPIVLIAGGRNKKLPMGEWANEIRKRVRVLVVMGDAAEEIKQAVLSASDGSLPQILEATSMDDAVAQATSKARRGDVVLLAPGGTSFDMFKDFEERGEKFRLAVNRLSLRGEEGQ